MDPTANWSAQLPLADQLVDLVDYLARDYHGASLIEDACNAIDDDEDHEAARKLRALFDAADELAELVRALHGWIGSGGFLPAQITVSTGTPTPAQGIAIARLMREAEAVSASVTRPRKDEDRHHVDVTLWRALGWPGGPPQVAIREARIARDGSEVT